MLDKTHCQSPYIFPAYKCHVVFNSIILSSIVFDDIDWFPGCLSCAEKRTKRGMLTFFSKLITFDQGFYDQSNSFLQSAIWSQLTHSTVLAYGSSEWCDIRQRILISICNWQDLVKNLTEVRHINSTHSPKLLHQWYAQAKQVMKMCSFSPLFLS